MRALLDVNVLIALSDPDHVFHSVTKTWWVKSREDGWATSPMTQNGCVRIINQPAYPNPQTVSTLVKLLAHTCSDPCHEFWPDDASILDAKLFQHAHIHSHRQITDLYLLGLAVRNGGRLVTFDRQIPLSAIHGAKKQHVLVL